MCGMQNRVSTYKDMPPIDDAPQRVVASSDLSREDVFPGRVPRDGITVEEFLARRGELAIVDVRATPDLPNESSISDSSDAIPKHHHRRRMICSNALSIVLATAITASVTLAVRFSNCE